MDGLYGWPLFPSVAATSIRCCPVARASLACVESPKRWHATPMNVVDTGKMCTYMHNTT